MGRKTKNTFLDIFLIIFIIIIVTILFLNSLLYMLSKEFIKNVLIIASLTFIGVSLVGFQMKNEFINLRTSFLIVGSASILSMLTGLVYLSYNSITFGKLSVGFFTGAIISLLFLFILATTISFKKDMERKEETQ